MSVSVLTRLIKQSSGRCHYCNRRTNRTVGSPLQATREHVVPRSMGGPNSINNYVLACADCNNRRGTILFFCSCDFCSSLIGEAMSSQEFIDNIFESMMRHNTYTKVFYDSKPGLWTARRGHVRRHFQTWKQAMEYANNGSFMKGE